jgi:type IV secretory pathway VirB2 component (pilin)
VWTLQGLDVMGGSAMSGVTAWAVVGPIVAVVGIVLAATSLRRRRALA